MYESSQSWMCEWTYNTNVKGGCKVQFINPLKFRGVTNQGVSTCTKIYMHAVIAWAQGTHQNTQKIYAAPKKERCYWVNYMPPFGSPMYPPQAIYGSMVSIKYQPLSKHSM